MSNIRKQSNESFRTKQTYIRNADPFLTASQLGYATYADAAGTSPVDGTGGSPNVTFEVNTSSPISNDADFRFVKDASNRQGEGGKTDFVIDNIHLARVLQGSVECQLISGTYATGDIRFYLVETTSGEVIEPVNVELGLGIIGQTIKHIFSFQTNITNTTYRLCVHVASTSALAYTVAFNNFKVWEPLENYGAIITDWQAYTPTIKGAISDPTEGSGVQKIARWRRNGGSIDIEMTYLQTGSGSAGSGVYYWTLPSGLSIDPSHFQNTSSNSQNVVGSATAYSAGLTFTTGACYVYGDGTSALGIGIFVGNESTNPFQVGSASSIALNSGAVRYTFRASVPIAGWGSNMALSSDAGDGRLVRGTYTGHTSVALTAGVTNIKFNTKQKDTHSAYDTSTGILTIPVAGDYLFSHYGLTSPSDTEVPIYINGVESVFGFFISRSGTQASGSVLVTNLKAGDQVSIRSASASLTMGSSFPTFSFFRISASNQIIAPVENVACAYSMSANTTPTTNQLNFDAKQFDTHGAVTTGVSWKFTAPMNGKYLVSAFMYTGTASVALRCYKNGSRFMGIAYALSTGCEPKFVIDLLAGDYIDLRFASDPGTVTGGTLSSSDLVGHIEIVRMGI